MTVVSVSVSDYIPEFMKLHGRMAKIEDLLAKVVPDLLKVVKSKRFLIAVKTVDGELRRVSLSDEVEVDRLESLIVVPLASGG